MRAFFAHMQKEWREQRWVLAAIGAAIVLLTAGGAWAFAEKAFQLERGTPFYVGACTALTMFALSTELFAAEGRRDGFGFLRRLPHGLGVAFAAKVVFYVLSCSVTAAFGAATLLAVTAVAGGAPAVLDLLGTLQFLDAFSVLVVPGLVVCLGLWILCVSTWVPRGAAAAGAALLLLAAVGAPVVLALESAAWFEVPLPWLVGGAIGAVLVPLAATAWGLLRGLRFARSPWSAAWRGLALVFAVALPAYAAGHSTLERWKDLQADEPDLTLYGAVIARGGSFAYVNLGRPGESCRVDTEFGPRLEQLTRAFRIDLKTGRAFPMGPLGSEVSPGTQWLRAWSPYGDRTAGIVAVARQPHDKTLTWWDAVRGEPVQTVPRDVFPEGLVGRLRAELRAVTPVRLQDGRPVWIFREQMEHDDGHGGVTAFPLPFDVRQNWSTELGWAVWHKGTGMLLAPDDDGRPVLHGHSRPEELASVHLTSDRFLTREKRKGPWLVVEGESRASTPALEPADEPGSRLDETHVLVRRPVGASNYPYRLRIADLAAGTSSAVRLPAGAPDVISYAGVTATTPAGRKIVTLTAPARVAGQGGVAGYLVWDPASGRLGSWTPTAETSARSVTVLDESTLIETEEHRLLRRTLGTDDTEVLWPRR